MSLFVDELEYQGLHLGGSRRPDGIFYKDTNGVIVDTKAYSSGYIYLLRKLMKWLDILKRIKTEEI